MEMVYRLDDAGWAGMTITTPEQSVFMIASYLHDSLKQLAEASLHLTRGIMRTVISFVDEPGEHQLILEKGEADLLRVEIRWFKDWASWNYVSVKYDVVAQFTTSFTEFGVSVLNNLETLLLEHGEAGYKEKWRHDFPIAEYERLKAI